MSSKLKVIYRFSDAAQKGKCGEDMNKKRYHNFNKRAIYKHFIENFGVDKKDIFVIADNTCDESYNYLLTLLPEEQVIRIDVKSGAFSFLYAIQYCIDNYTSDTIVYLVEDDYLHLPGSAKFLIEPFEEFPEVSYVTLYDHVDKYTHPVHWGSRFAHVGIGGIGEISKVIRSKSIHWKYTSSTTMTFACRLGTLREDMNEYNKHCHTGYPNDFELFWELCNLDKKPSGAHVKERILINCIPTKSTHYEAGWYSKGVDWDNMMEIILSEYNYAITEVASKVALEAPSSYPIHIHITARGGNQFFQYWTAKYIAYELKRPLTVHFCETLYLDNKLYPNLDLPEQKYIPTYMPNVQPDAGIYCYHDHDDVKLISMNGIIEKHRTSSVPLHLRFNAEDFVFMRPRQDFVKNLYKRSDEYPLIQNGRIVIHIRLGDLMRNYIDLQDMFIKACSMIITKHDLNILIVTENTDHPCIFFLKRKLKEVRNTFPGINNKVDIIDGSSDDWQRHFDTISSASVIIMSHSTFSWWAAYLNPFTPVVYALITYSNKCFHTIRNSLFDDDSPDGWRIYNMDTEKFHTFTNGIKNEITI